MGVRYLSNRTMEFREDIAVTGIDLAERYYKKFHPDHLRPEEIGRLAGPAERERFLILLCHSPLFFDSCRKWGADLTLSGHFHGGTIRLPYLGGVMTPQFQFFLPWCAGTFEENGKTTVIVPYNNEAVELLSQLTGDSASSQQKKQALRKLQRFTVAISGTEKRGLEDAIHSVWDGRVLVLDERYYDKDNLGVTQIPGLMSELMI